MKTLILTLALLLAASSCSREIMTYVDWDSAYDLNSFRTYTWSSFHPGEENNDPRYYNELNNKRITDAVNSEMTEKGYRLDTMHADLIIHYHIIVKDKTVLKPDPFGHYPSAYWQESASTVYQYLEGTLIIDMMDSKNRNLIWRGWAVAPLENIRKPGDIGKLIQLSVHKILAPFPDKGYHPDNGLSRTNPHLYDR